MTDTIGRFKTPREMAHEFFASVDRTDEPEPQGRGVSDLRDDEPRCEDCGAPRSCIREYFDYGWMETWYKCSRCGAKYTPEEMEEN